MTQYGRVSGRSEELYERLSLVVDKGQEPMRLDKFLVARIESASRNKVQQAIETGRYCQWKRCPPIIK